MEIRLDEKKAKLLGEFALAMQDLYGGALVSLYIFGEGAVEPGHALRVTKLLAVVKEVGPAQLKKYAAVYNKWHRKGIPAPLMMTREMLESSTDVFPIEFLEMKESNQLIYGEDVLAGLRIGLDNLRRQCEEQAKGKLIHLQQGYIEAGGDKKALAGLIAASVEPFTEVMRNVLRMMGKGAPVRKDEVIRDFCREAELDEAPFAEALRLRREDGKRGMEELEALFARYLEQVRLMAEKLDKM